jgi:signal transduction histidine kinase/HAMP domain-containing protein
MRRAWDGFFSQIKYTIILPYLALVTLVLAIGSGIALVLVTDNWQERFDNQMGQVARNFSEAFARHEIDNISYLTRIAFTVANPENGAPAVAFAIRERDEQGLAQAIEPLYQLGIRDVNLDRMIIFDPEGRALLDWEPSSTDPSEPVRYIGTDLSGLDFIQRVLRGEAAPVPGSDVSGDKFSGLIKFRSSETGDRVHFYTVTPVYVDVDGNRELVGGVMVATRLDHLLQDLQRQSQAAITALYDLQGVTLQGTLPDQDTALLDMSEEQLRQVAELNRQGRLAATSQAGEQLVDDASSDVCLDIGRLSGNPIGAVTQTRLPVCSIKASQQFSDRTYQTVYAPLLIRGVHNGYFSVSLPNDFVVSAWASSRNAILGVTGILTLGAVLLGVWVSRKITRPLGDLVDTAAAVTSGQLDRRSRVTDRNELGQLSLAFNQMTEHLLRLYTASRELNRAIEIEEVLTIASDSASSFVDKTECVALLRTEDGWRYYVRSDAPASCQNLVSVVPRSSDPLFGYFADHQQQQTYLLHASTDSALLSTGLSSVADLHTVLAAPMLAKDELIGVLFLGNSGEHAFGEADRQGLTVVANMAVTVLYNAVLFTQAQKDAKQRQAILASIGDGVVVADGRRQIVLLNTVAEQLFDLGDWREQRLTLDDLPLEKMTQTREVFGQRRGEHFQVGDRVVSRTLTPVIAEDGRTIGEVVILHDITAEMAVDKAKTDFIATISHELRTPLTVIRGFTELLLRGTGGEKVTADQAELLEQVRARAVDMTDMVNNAILIADIESGQLKTELHPQDVEMVLGMALAPLRPGFEAKRLSVEIDMPTDLPPVYADREQLKRAFTQILDNARRYTDKGGITVCGRTENGRVLIDFKDTGQGIAPDVLPRLFKRFQRVEGNNSQQRGGGLGLAITKQLIELQGGEVRAVSTPGQGSVFTISLTQVHEQTLAVAQPNETRSAT